MAIRADSYGSVAEVQAYVTHLLDGKTAFSASTRPTDTQIEKFLDRSSAYVNVALNQHGFSTPITSTSNSTASILLDDWVVNKATMMVELTKRGEGFNEREGSRASTFDQLAKDAMEFVEENSLGLQRLGLTLSHKLSDGLKFTAEADQSLRPDPDDSTLEQPIFNRGLFDSTKSDAGEDTY